MTAQTVRPVEQEAPTSKRKRKWWEYVTNLNVNVKDRSVKKMTIKIKGKAGVDIRNTTVTMYADETCKWVFSNGKEVK